VKTIQICIESLSKVHRKASERCNGIHITGALSQNFWHNIRKSNKKSWLSSTVGGANANEAATEM